MFCVTCYSGHKSHNYVLCNLLQLTRETQHCAVSIVSLDKSHTTLCHLLQKTRVTHLCALSLVVVDTNHTNLCCVTCCSGHESHNSVVCHFYSGHESNNSVLCHLLKWTRVTHLFQLSQWTSVKQRCDMSIVTVDSNHRTICCVTCCTGHESLNSVL